MTKTRNSSKISLQGISNSATIYYRPSPFIISNPKRWFRRIEIQFELREITSTMTKFALLASAIPLEAFDLIADLETKNDYVEAKNVLFKNYGSSVEESIQRLSDLFSGEAQGLSAIQLASSVRALLDNKVIKDTIRPSIREITVPTVHPSKKL
ncbi:unnamed protein product [Lepeophtheirus salmonis]|uniref:(salmon louse) hypothetical protein n=1 Tax=Lepeophtheirus salmonis TaxID=72036 RepID=A0A7R8CU84_LEPSM|nr:unnamed protein product [Lepeophtheirus salmonis]CAF2882396.1 unnamed protein product [Lepeophtheirus salmonis]